MEYTSSVKPDWKFRHYILERGDSGWKQMGWSKQPKRRAHDLLDATWDEGINFIDTANAYGTTSGTAERWIGDWLADYDREEVVIALKVYFDVETGYPDRGGLIRKDIRHHIRETLNRLGTEYLDIDYIHRWDEETSILQTLRTLIDLFRIGGYTISVRVQWQLATHGGTLEEQ